MRFASIWAALFNFEASNSSGTRSDCFEDSLKYASDTLVSKTWVGHAATARALRQYEKNLCPCFVSHFREKTATTFLNRQ